MQENRTIPKVEGKSQTANMIREGYQFLRNRRKGLQSNIFETHVLGEKVICLSGEKAAELFYDTEKFIRKGAMPKRFQETLTGEGGVQSLDGAAHQHRKEAFMSLMSADKINQLKEMARGQWERKLSDFEKQQEVNVYKEAQELLLRLACQWAGVPLKEKEVQEKKEAIIQLFESPVTLGYKQWKAKKARQVLETWLGGLIKSVRKGDLIPFEGTAMKVFAFHRDENNELLKERIAAVEVLNIIRPIVAISIYIAFEVHAIIQHPQEHKRLASGDEKDLQDFVQEVRRLYPFFPFNAARVKKDFTWEGYTFKKGTLTMLDFYGTNHDPSIWNNPEVFNPMRFKEEPITPYNLIPQGGGEFVLNHRCAGEWATIEVMKVSLDYFANRMTFDVPKQDLSYSLVDIPSIPKSKIILKNVKRKNY
ncbi:cytochrome P450 [Sporosarcina sp. P16b]|uniref:cytochrome P450 n=1 Tax=Sporosarcina sp. P16b TaxID=2048261 RepID=UPI000C16B65D|nr:cytochrome P450 [Sporosarcina sp. P16b]PIC70520.1 cytochrome P450 [Sporosarcina sp. P16b]